MKYKISEIASLLGGEIEGDKDLEVKGLSPFFQAQEGDLTFAADEKFIKQILRTRAGAVIVPPIENLPEGKTYIKVTRNPREVMPILLSYFKPKLKKMVKSIEDSAELAEGVEVGPHCYIGHDVHIGEGTVIYPNVTISQGVKIGKNCTIYSNVSIREFCELGDNCIVQPGAVVGSDGFGFVKVNGNNTKIDQIGRVIVGNNVEIGANTTIDRGAIGDTIIKNYTKFDNLVHVGHNDIIGENCLMVAQVGISGSTEIGDNVTLAGQVGVSGHLKIGDNVTIGPKSGVTNDVEANSFVSGYPLIDHKENLKVMISLKRLPELVKKVKLFEKRLKNLEEDK